MKRYNATNAMPAAVASKYFEDIIQKKILINYLWFYYYT